MCFIIELRDMFEDKQYTILSMGGFVVNFDKVYLILGLKLLIQNEQCNSEWNFL